MSKKEIERDIQFIKEMVDDLFTIVISSIDCLHIRINKHDQRIKRLENRIAQLEQEVFDEY